MSDLGSEQRPLLVAVVGSGPSGFYATESLLKSDLNVRVTMLERLPVPYGLVRSGVAPDHPKLKQAIQVYAKIAESVDFKLLANVTVGEDINVKDLSETHHAIIFAHGAETDRKLGILGEELRGSHTATEFVGWYNGHPDYRDRVFDLSSERAVIIGQGNVAADVARILAKSVDELRNTDIAEHALEALQSYSQFEHTFGERGAVGYIPDASYQQSRTGDLDNEHSGHDFDPWCCGLARLQVIQAPLPTADSPSEALVPSDVENNA